MMLSDLLNRLKKRIHRLFTRANWDMLTELARANFKVQDHNSLLGVFWSLLGPIVTSVVLYFIFRTRFGQGIREYPLYLLAGVICVNFFATATSYMVNIFFENRDFVLNSMVPRETILLSALATHIYKFLIDLVLCLGLSIFYGVFTWKIFLLVGPLVIAFIAFVLGINMIISLLFCFAGDVQHIWLLMTRLFYFITPVFYTLDSLHPVTRNLIYFGNPLTPFVISFQNIFMGQFAPAVYAHSLLVGLVVFTFGYGAFIIIENMAVEEV